MIALGATKISKVCLGSDELRKVCLGSTEIWSAVPPLPYDAELEYLQSDSNQYIDTAITATPTLIAEVEFSVISNFSFGSGAFMFGAYDLDKTSYSLALNSSTAMRVPNGNVFANFTVPNIGTSKHVLEYQFGNIVLDDAIKSTSRGIIGTPVTLRIFSRKNISGTQTGGANGLRIYGFKLTDNNTTLIDLIPVRVGQVGYMYDKISGQLFVNDGTGSFALGPDKQSA